MIRHEHLRHAVQDGYRAEYLTDPTFRLAVTMGDRLLFELRDALRDAGVHQDTIDTAIKRVVDAALPDARRRRALKQVNETLAGALHDAGLPVPPDPALAAEAAALREAARG